MLPFEFDDLMIRLIVAIALIVATLLVAFFLVTREYGRSTLNRYVRLHNAMQRHRRALRREFTRIRNSGTSYKDDAEKLDNIRGELYRVGLAMTAIQRRVKRTWGVTLSEEEENHVPDEGRNSSHPR